MTDTQPKTTPETFCIWLQGFLDGAGSELTSNQLSALKEKLHTVFSHFNPDTDSRTSDTVSEELRRVYDEYLRDREKKVPLSPFVPSPWSPQAPVQIPIPYNPYRHPGIEPWNPHKYVYRGPAVTQTWNLPLLNC
jgi:hypothetical protein